MKIEWAVLTKFPRDQFSFERVLASSGDNLSTKKYENLILKWLTGEMAPPKTNSLFTPGEPWYQFGVEDNPREQIVVLRQEWAGYSDAYDRPIKNITCLLLPFDEIAKAGCGFRQMVDIFEQQVVKTLLKEANTEIAQRKTKFDNKLLEIELPAKEISIQWMQDAIEAYGIENCKQAANTLLKGKPVGMYMADQKILPWEKRLQVLDAALALLPYGLRADCPASLWALGTKDSNPMRLYWVGMPLLFTGHTALKIDPSKLSSEDLSEGYIQEIDEWLREKKLEKVLEILVNQSNPLSFAKGLPDNYTKMLENSLGFLKEVQSVESVDAFQTNDSQSQQPNTVDINLFKTSDTQNKYSTQGAGQQSGEHMDALESQINFLSANGTTELGSKFQQDMESNPLVEPPHEIDESAETKPFLSKADATNVEGFGHTSVEPNLAANIQPTEPKEINNHEVDDPSEQFIAIFVKRDPPNTSKLTSASNNSSILDDMENMESYTQSPVASTLSGKDSDHTLTQETLSIENPFPTDAVRVDDVDVKFPDKPDRARNEVGATAKEEMTQTTGFHPSRNLNLTLLLKESIKAFNSLQPNKLGSYLDDITPLLQNGLAEQLFRSLWAECEKYQYEKPTMDFLFIQLLHFALLIGNNPLQALSGQAQNTTILVSLTTKDWLQPHHLYSWAYWVLNNNQNPEPLSQILQQYSDEAPVLTRALQIVWGISSESLSEILILVDQRDRVYVAVLMKVSISRGETRRCFEPTARKYLDLLKAGGYKTLPEEHMSDWLSNPLLNPQNLTDLQSALLDEIRLALGVGDLTVSQMLVLESSRLSIYEAELKQFISTSEPDQLYVFSTKIYSIIETLAITVGDDESIATNLADFCHMMREVTDENRWNEIILKRREYLILNAIRLRTAPEELAKVCWSILEKKNVAQNELGWLINFLSKHRYPNTAQDLWCLVGLLGNYATQTNKKGWVYELEFHRAVINEHKILTDTTERNNYLLLAIEQANYQLVLIGRLAQVPQITYSPTWRNWHQFLMNGTIPKLKMKLSQTK